MKPQSLTASRPHATGNLRATFRNLLLSSVKLYHEKFLRFYLVAFAITFCFAKCKKEHNGLTITLYDKPLATIQSYVQGKWKLQYARGGFCGTCVWPARHNEYMLIKSQKIVFGNDSVGVVADTTINWVRAKAFNDSTYLLTYYYPPGAGPFPISYVVNGIYNDTLKLMDYASDPIYYYYTKY